MTRPLLLHVGYHKTATSWMQNLLFQPPYGFVKLASHAEIFAHVVRPHGLRWDAQPMRDLIAARLAEADPGLAPVVSSEILSGHPFQGGHESDVYAERLHQIAPDGRVLIGVRNQMRILPSVYMQYVLRGGTMPYERFFEGEDTVGYFGFTPEHFEYDRLVARYQALFGAGNVLVLTQEGLSADMEGTAARLAGFAGNARFEGLSEEARGVYAPSYPEHAAAILRRVNHVQKSTLNPAPIVSLGETPKGLYRALGWLSRRPPISTVLGRGRPVSDHVARRFAGYYTDSNRRLGALTGLDLSSYP